MNILIAIHIPQPCMGISKSGPVLNREAEKTGGDQEEEGVVSGAWQDVFTAVMVMN